MARDVPHRDGRQPEGTLIARWPEKIKAGRVSNEIVHVTDIFTTLARVGGAEVPSDQPIDGVDQLPFLLAGDADAKSAREGFLFYIKQELRALRWREGKLRFHWEPEVNGGKGKLESPYLFNVTRDPKEETDILVFNKWVMGPMLKLVKAFNDSVKGCPNTPPGQED